MHCDRSRPDKKETNDNKPERQTDRQTEKEVEMVKGERATGHQQHKSQHYDKLGDVTQQQTLQPPVPFQWSAVN